MKQVSRWTCSRLGPGELPSLKLRSTTDRLRAILSKKNTNLLFAASNSWLVRNENGICKLSGIQAAWPLWSYSNSREESLLFAAVVKLSGREPSICSSIQTLRKGAFYLQQLRPKRWTWKLARRRNWMTRWKRFILDWGRRREACIKLAATFLHVLLSGISGIYLHCGFCNGNVGAT